MNTVALVCSEPLKPNMAGIAIRYTELARELAQAGFGVTLFTPELIEGYQVPDRVNAAVLLNGSESEQLKNASTVLVQGHLAETILDAVPDTPVVVDLYDPYLIENSCYAEELGPEVFQNDLRNWQQLCQRGDFFLCASEAQRLFYAGFLLAQQRVNPARLKDDPNLRKLIDVVPFGVSSTLPAHQPYLPSAKPETFRILFGGLYDWYDPFTLLEALNVNECQHCELIFVRNPNPNSTPQRLLGEVEAWFSNSGWPQERLTVIDWVPYARRYDLLRDVDLMVATHADTFESSLSLRTRFLDAIASGCPIICSDGGEVSKLITKYHAGVLVPPGNPEELRNAIITALHSKQQGTTSQHNRQAFINDYSWSKVSKPLKDFCAAPKKSPDKITSPTAVANQGSEPDYQFSILLPTYNRMDILPEVLDALEQQWGAPRFELVLVNDGSTDGTHEWLAEREFSIPATVIHQDNAGPAAARNCAIQNASGDYVVLLGDDTVPDRYWLQAHLNAHKERNFDKNLIVVGQIDWHERMTRTPFIRFVDETGWQFAFDKIDDPDNLPFNYFYGSNLSLPSHHLKTEQFDTSFPYPAWEDSELGYRLHCNGCQFVFQPAARTAHLHKTTIGRFADRQMKAGYCAMVFNRLHPEIGALVWPSSDSLNNASGKWPSLIRRTLASALELLPISLPTLWNKVLRDHYVAGIRQYLSDHNIAYDVLSKQEIFPIVYQARSPVLHHHTGTLEQSHWVCRVNEHAPGHCVFGPNYRVSHDGALIVTFQLSCDALPDCQEHAVTLDVYDNSNDVVLTEQVLYSDQITSDTPAALVFSAKSGQQLEFRVYWHGNCTIAIENIALSQHSNDH